MLFFDLSVIFCNLFLLELLTITENENKKEDDLNNNKEEEYINKKTGSKVIQDEAVSKQNKMNVDKKESMILNNLNVNNIAKDKESTNKQKEISGFKIGIKNKTEENNGSQNNKQEEEELTTINELNVNNKFNDYISNFNSKNVNNQINKKINN